MVTWCALLLVWAGLLSGACSEVVPATRPQHNRSEMPVIILPIYKGKDLYHVVIWKEEAWKYDKIIRKFCYDYQIAAFSCDNVLRIAGERVSQEPLDHATTCRVNVTREDCIELLVNIATPPKTEFETLDMKLLGGYSEGLQLSHLQSLEKFMTLLHDRECTHIRINATYSAPDSRDISPNLSLRHLVDDSNYLVPCNTMQWAAGRWLVHSSTNSRDFSISRCPKGKAVFVDESSDAMAWRVLCGAHFPVINMQPEAAAVEECVIYSFRGSQQPLQSSSDLEKWAAGNYGCSVHIFDLVYDPAKPPKLGGFGGIQEHREFRMTAVDSNFSSALQYDLRAAKRLLGHTGRPIDAVKIDCDGCEWAILNESIELYPDETLSVCNLVTRLHFCDRFGNMSSSANFEELNLMTHFYNQYVLTGPFKMTYRHQTSRYSYKISADTATDAHDAWSVLPILKNMGFDPSFCSYEVVLTNELCIPNSENSESIATPTPESHILDDPLKRIDIFNNPSVNVDNFAEMHRYLSLLNAKVALLSVDPSLHSEIIGPFVDLFYSLGFSHVTVYYDFYKESDGYRWADKEPVYASMVPIFEGWERWDIRPARYCFPQSAQWDVLVMLTGDEIYRNAELVRSIQSIPHRVIAVQHHPSWIVPSLYSKNLLLTPYHGSSHFVFPFMRVSQHLRSSLHHIQEYERAIDLRPLSSNLSEGLLLLGSIGEIDRKTRAGVDKKYKDKQDIIRYLQQSPDHRVHCIVKQPGDHFENIVRQFPSQAVLFYGIHTFDLLKVVEMSTFLWLPIPPDSLYMKGSFASSLSFAFGLGKVLVVPKALSAMYKLHGAVVEYKHSITEVDWSLVDVPSLQSRMKDWEAAQRTQNLVNVYRCLFSDDHCAKW